jgi:cohesin loading factor subunit SCC2
MIVEADPSVLERSDVRLGVNHSFLDHSTSVREAAVDLVGRFIISRPNLVHHYYEMLSKRILVSEVPRLLCREMAALLQHIACVRFVH